MRVHEFVDEGFVAGTDMLAATTERAVEIGI